MSNCMNNPCWVWAGFAVPKRNAFVSFRRAFSAREGQRLSLSISADSRYWLWINGKMMGQGPVRSWVDHWKADVYDLSGELRDGRNVIAVLVNHFGLGTFQYLPSEPGLVVQVRDRGDKLVLQTDAKWRCRIAGAYSDHAPRISVQLGFEEQFDARKDDGWLQSDYKEVGWTAARSVAAPHPALEPRGIPHLAVEPVTPCRLMRAERVKPAAQTWTLDLRSFLFPSDTSCKVHFVRGHLFTQIWSGKSQDISFVRPHYHQGEFKVNEKTVPALEGTAPPRQPQRVRLNKGWNTVLIPYPHWPPVEEGAPARSHFGHFVLAVRAASPLKWAAKGRHGGAAWAFIGPFGFSSREEGEIRSDRDYPRILVAKPCDTLATPTRFRRIYEEASSADDMTRLSCLREIPERWVCRNDVFALASGDEVAGGHSLVDGNAMLSANGEWTIVPPARSGEDVRLLFDFGREIVGCHTFEVEADEGTILDFHQFEFIQPDGRENWSEGMNNSFRYVCRQGKQRYRTLLRRGFQYSYLICRNLRGPLRIRSLGADFIAYPQARRGSFHCSDPLLNAVWEAGAHTLRCCSEDTYTDCPSNEQVHWTGDARNEALVDWVVNGDPRLWHRVLVQTGQSLELPEFPITASQVPSAWPNIMPAWSFLWMRSCREYLLWTGDVASARRLLPWIRRNVEGISAHLGRNGLFTMQAYNLFDWAPMDTPATGTVTHINCFAVLALLDSAELAAWLGQRAFARRLRGMAASLKTAINRHLWDKERGAYVDSLHFDGSRSRVFSQQTQTVAWISGVATGERAARSRARITDPPADFVRAGSPFFGFFLLELLARERRGGELLERIRDDWGFMLRQGATTFWEMWSLRSGRLTRSHCHGWSAAPTFFLSSAVLGIEPTSPGFATVRITPRLGDLRFAEGVMPTPHGPIEVRFERKGKSLLSHIRLPDGVVREATRR